MKKYFLLSLVLLFSSQMCLAQANETNNEDPFKSPYFQEMKKRDIEKIKKEMNKNKNQIMESLNRIQKYTDEEYQQLYNNYELNPPYIEKDGNLELNPDYVSKNKPYIKKDGKYVKNENYIPVERNHLEDIRAVIESSTEQKRLGKKSFSLNPDAFY